MIDTGLPRPPTRSPDESSVPIMPIAPRVSLPASFPPAAEYRARLIPPATDLRVHRPVPHRRLLAVPGAEARFKSP